MARTIRYGCGTILLSCLVLGVPQVRAFLLIPSGGRGRTIAAPVVLAEQRGCRLSSRTCVPVLRPLEAQTDPSNQQSDSERSGTDRRNFLIQTPASIASSLSLLLFPSTPAASASVNNNNNNGKTILITGANSGVGFEACKHLATTAAQEESTATAATTTTLILACRTLEKAQDAVDRIRSSTSSGTEPSSSSNNNGVVLIPAACDLTSLQSIQSFAQNLPVDRIDTLCLNAGISRNTEAKDCARTKDGFELTVGTNHFGHFYLNHLLLPKMARNGRIVVTASSVHDPESPGGAQGMPATLGDLKGLEVQGKDCEMVDGNKFNADKAYKDSKLCNVLFTRELQRRLDRNEATQGISVNCFSPGLIVGTGLFRDQNPVFTKLFDVAATKLFKVGETPEWGGASLAYMTTVNTKGQFYDSPPGSSKYGDAAFGKQFSPSSVSKEGQDDAKAERLWELSSKLLGIS